jgi:hypothetical protein
MKRTILLPAAAGALLLAFAAGCGSEWSQSHNHNTPVGNYVAPKNVVIEFPYNFDNIARSCVDGDGVYVGFKDHGAFVVANDPACKNGGQR